MEAIGLLTIAFIIVALIAHFVGTWWDWRKIPRKPNGD